MSLAAQSVAVLLQSFSTSWRMFCIMFLFIGASQISLYISAFVLGTELEELNWISLLLVSWLSVIIFLLSLHRNGGAEQDNESDLRHAGRLPLLLHRLHDAAVDCLRHQGVEDAAGRPVHDLGGQHPSVVVGFFAGKAPPNRCTLTMTFDP